MIDVRWKVVIASYRGHIVYLDALAAFTDFMASGQGRGLPHLAEMSGVRSYEPGYERLVTHHQPRASVLANPDCPAVVVYHCPGQIACDMCQRTMPFWQSYPGISAHMTRDGRGVTAALGLPHEAATDLLNRPWG